MQRGTVTGSRYLVAARSCGNVIYTEASVKFCDLIPPDSGHIQQEDARYAPHKDRSKHKAWTLLYTLRDAETALNRPI